MWQAIHGFLQSTGFASLTWGHILMICVALVLMYLAIVRKFEPLLLVPISFGILLANLPLAGHSNSESGLLHWLYQGVKLGIYPPLIFLGIGASTDFGPLIANPKT
ncbi:MAG TPA: glutaconyl-CoA decarboxylase subunit beta, partial [Firmicutes bacterium]|nr:glutaconyl-CoA decarboxylase subunit beta [Bacillota bacterium]HAZ21219.1 glutaconyl-CoA decarboxylase subunit beta [Bacillota bacterium]HBG43047.1 glutaconyl-CoA decarboxylase subunit beta [Bacillota bacterium]